MNHIIKHKGIIEQIDGAHIRVRILQMAACGSCVAAKHCNASETRTKIIDVTASDASLFAKGQGVIVSTTGSIVKHATVISFVLPLLILICTLIFAKAGDFPDELAALIAIGFLVVYYLGIWLLKDHISKRISFQIEPE